MVLHSRKYARCAIYHTDVDRSFIGTRKIFSQKKQNYFSRAVSFDENPPPSIVSKNRRLQNLQYEP